jgi:hypothetical protein
MTYVQQGLIQASDFNNFSGNGVSGPNVNATWNATYGQPALGTVNTNGTVSATIWSTMNTYIANMALHQGSVTTVTSRSGPTVSQTIAIQNALATDIANCYTNRLSANTVGSQFTAYTGTSYFATNIGNTNNNTAGAWTATFTDTITFANSTAANSWFNCGGYIKIQFNKSTTGTVADTEWNQFIGNVASGGAVTGVVANAIIITSDASSKVIAGTTYLGTNKIGGTGSATPATSIGFNQMTTGGNVIYQQFDSGAVYGSNYVKITASKNATGNVVTLSTVWYDNGDTSFSGPTTSITGGTPTTGITFGTGPATVVTLFPPETGNIANVWGSFSVASSVANT